MPVQTERVPLTIRPDSVPVADRGRNDRPSVSSLMVTLRKTVPRHPPDPRHRSPDSELLTFPGTPMQFVSAHQEEFKIRAAQLPDTFLFIKEVLAVNRQPVVNSRRERGPRRR